MTALAGLAQRLFAPSTVALVGASNDPRKHGARPQQHLRQHGFPGAIFPVNPAHAEVLGEPAYPSVTAIGAPIDHAFILLPAEAVAAAVTECAAANVGCITVLSGGFAEAGPEGRARQEALVATARRGDARLLGPNSIGIVNPVDRVALSANEALALPELPRGRYGLVSQSGSLLGALVSRAVGRGIGFSRIASVGNEADLGVGEIADMLVDDPATDAILLFIETIRDADRIAAMAHRAHAAGKPVVCFRLGRSAEGKRLAASHTGALAGDGAAVDAFLDDCGIVRVGLLDTLLDLPALLVGRRPSIAARVAVMSTTGGGGGLLVDALAEREVALAPPEPALVAQLRAQGIAAGESALLDLTLAGTNATTVGATLRTLLESPECDLVAAVVGSSAQFHPERAIDPAIAESRRCGDKPLAMFIAPQADEARARLQQAGIAAFLTAETCADGIAAYLRWRAPRLRVVEEERDAHPHAHVVAALGDATAGGLDEMAARRVFTALGIPQSGDILLPPDPRGFDPEITHALPFPIVAKVLSPDIVHKTEAGAVALGIASADDLHDACTRMLHEVRRRLPQARIRGICIQPQERGLAEVLVGYRLDPEVGPTVMLGAGGVLAELYRDVAVRLAPVDLATAHDMIGTVRGLAPLRGYRGLPRGDLDALAAAIRAMSRLALVRAPRVLEAEANPILVRAQGQGVVAVDALITVEAATAHPSAPPSTYRRD